MATEAGGDQNAKDLRETRRTEREKRGLISVYDFQSIEKDSCSHLMSKKERNRN